jgi:hypothetical protein
MIPTNVQDERPDLKSQIARPLVAELRLGIAVVERIDDRVYTRTMNGAGSIGGQFRHSLDFVNGFLKGIFEGRIDYNDRERDLFVEINRDHAIAKTRTAIACLARLPETLLIKVVSARSEISPQTWFTSSAARELEFIHSHTVHHHALIAEKLRAFGVAAPPHFGAPGQR